MRIPTFDTAAKAALTLAVAATVAALPTSANAALPVTVDDVATTTPGAVKVIEVLQNDTDEDGNETLGVTANTDATHGAVTCDETTCTYTPTSGWAGADTFTYTVSDGTDTDTGEVTVTTVAVASIVAASTPSAGLTWPTAITVDSPAPTAKLVGTVKQSGGAPIEGVEAELLHKPTGATEYTHLAGPLTTNELGKVSVSGITLTAATTYKWKVGNKLSGLALLSVTPGLSTKFTPKSLAADDTVTVTGSSGPAIGDEAVQLQRRNATGSWVEVANGVLGSPDADGYADYSFELPANDSGKYTYRVVLEKANGRNAVTSGQSTVKRYDAKVVDVHPQDADEFVTIRNIGKVGLNLTDWVLSQGARSVTLPKRSVGIDDILRIHSGRGTNGPKDLYLKGVDRWTSTGTITLTDDRDTVIDGLVYP